MEDLRHIAYKYCPSLRLSREPLEEVDVVQRVVRRRQPAQEPSHPPAAE